MKILPLGRFETCKGVYVLRHDRALEIVHKTRERGGFVLDFNFQVINGTGKQVIAGTCGLALREGGLYTVDLKLSPLGRKTARARPHWISPCIMHGKRRPRQVLDVVALSLVSELPFPGAKPV